MKYYVLFTFAFLSTLSCISQKLNTPTLSPITKISQEIGLTELTLEYSRPSAKGRAVFNDLVPYGKIWRTGANASTKITFTEPAFIGDQKIESGTYAIYTIPNKEMWTIIIHSNITLRSLAGDAYKQENDVFRFEVKPEQLNDYVDTFTMQFSDLTTNTVQLQLIWENTVVNIPIRVEVDEKIEAQMADFMKNPANIPHQTYFEAAQYYLNNNKDLKEALTFINIGIEKSAENARYGLLKAKIEHKKGDSKSALKTINLANSWAKKATNANYIEQTELFKKTLLDKK